MEDIVSCVFLPGACATLVAVLFTWAWTYDYQEGALGRREMEVDSEKSKDLLWIRIGHYLP